ARQRAPHSCEPVLHLAVRWINALPPCRPDFRPSAKMAGGARAASRGSPRTMQKALRKENPAAAQQHHAADLRTALGWLRSQGDLIETDKTVDPDLEITGLQKHMDGGCPVLFNNVKGKPYHRVV